MIRQRHPAHPTSEPTLSTPAPCAAAPAPRVTNGKGRTPSSGKMDSDSDIDSPVSSDEQQPLLTRDIAGEASAAAHEDDVSADKMGWIGQNKWIVLAIASGACAAFNGVFAKLTTTELTTTFAQWVAGVLHLDSIENVIEYIVRAMFFGLNLVFNGIMWTLFTQALAKGHSTTQVSIMNTSSNFVITAMLGLIIFSESLPPLWWVGATLLVVGNVIIGSKDESGKATGDGEGEGVGGDEGVAVPAPGLDGRGDYEDVPQIDGITNPKLHSAEDEDILELGDLEY